MLTGWRGNESGVERDISTSAAWNSLAATANWRLPAISGLLAHGRSSVGKLRTAIRRAAK
jgi:hypothetical protein